MTYISPLLQARLNSTASTQKVDNKHEKIYQDLQKRAHDAKPNEPKAYMVKEGMLGNPITAAKDTVKDVGNFFKAVKTGQIGDNNLGRINDVGLKVGALAIAAYLGLHAKTKTEAIMSYVGGATFVGMMSLWPKIFINIPARLVHGFRIDRKYISAQGDKKDFFLDNQFLVWDAYPEEQLRKDAKNAGIDYDSENGKEKIQRKMQKTALQNRTLWMATAGFATPLLTSMVGNFVEPEVKKAVVKNGVEKTKNVFENGLEEHFRNLTPDTTNNKALEALFKEYEDKVMDDDFFKKLERIFSFENLGDKFRHSDDVKPLVNVEPYKLTEQLKRAWADTTTIKLIDLDLSLVKPEVKHSSAIDSFFSVDGTDVKGSISTLDGAVVDSKQAAQEAIKRIKASLGDTFSVTRARQVLKEEGYGDKAIEELISKTAKDSSKFTEFIAKYNDEILAPLKARAKAYLDLLNPVIGSRAESAYTLEFRRIMNNFFKSTGISVEDYQALLKDKSPIEALSEIVVEATKGMDDEHYRDFIRQLNVTPFANNETVETLVESLKDMKEISKILPDVKEIDGIDVSALNKALLGEVAEDKGLLALIKQFIEIKEIDLKTIASKPIISANFERRLAKGDFAGILDTPEKIIAARKMVYDGTISTIKNKAEIFDKSEYRKIYEAIFKEDAFGGIEETVYPGIKKIISGLKSLAANGNLPNSIPTKDYLSCGSSSELMRVFLKEQIGNNKAWMKIFAPMTLVLIAVTLLVQPLFGKIDKEFPKESKNGGAK